MTGRLIYLMGPSGSGKDSLIDAARQALNAQGCQVARRVITRSAEAAGEQADSVSRAEFERLRHAGALAMSWEANGLSYGIPRQIDDWLAQGSDVLVNGSRGYLPQARRAYPTVLPVLLAVDEAVLRQRLLARGREPLAHIEQRLARNRLFAQAAQAAEAAEADVQVLDNSGALVQTVVGLLRLLQRPF